MASILERKESLLQEADRLEKEQFKKQIALLQEYYQKDAVRNKVKEAFAVLLEKWDREDAAFSLGIHYRYTNLHNRTVQRIAGQPFVSFVRICGRKLQIVKPLKNCKNKGIFCLFWCIQRGGRSHCLVSLW